MKVRGGLLVVLAGAALAGPVLAKDLVVIVHREREVRLGVEELGQIYMKRRRFWSNGDAIVPVNRNAGSEARVAFDRRVFGEQVPQLVVYWNRQYFRGVLPPPTLASDDAVRRFVASERLAVGYVDPASVDDSVRVVLHLRPR